MGREDRELDEVARSQRGVFSRDQATGVGFSRPMIQWRLRTGDWAPTRFCSVYRLPSHPRSWEQDLWGSVLWGGPGAAVGGRSAAALYGLDRSPPGPLELWLPSTAKHEAPRGVRVRRSDQLLVAREVDGLPVTDPETTLLGVARAVRVEVLDDVLESAFDLGLTTPSKLLLAIGRRAGSGPIRQILEGRVPGRPRQSRLEGEFFRMTEAAGIHLVRQYEVRINGKRYVLDYAAPELRTGVELEGFGKLRTKTGKQRFLERATALTLAGWRLLHFSWHDVVDRPAYVLDALFRSEIG